MSAPPVNPALAALFALVPRAQKCRPACCLRRADGTRVWHSFGYPGNMQDVIASKFCHPIDNWQDWLVLVLPHPSVKDAP